MILGSDADYFLSKNNSDKNFFFLKKEEKISCIKARDVYFSSSN